jgi:hypothetical protein
MGDKSDPGWWGKMMGDSSTYGGYTEEQLKQYDGMIRAELRAELKRENPKLPDSMIDQMMPAAGFTQKQGGGPQGGAQGMTAAPKPPGQGAPENTPQGAPPGMGQQIYSVLTQGGRVQRSMSKEQADALKSQGIDVTLVGGSTP